MKKRKKPTPLAIDFIRLVNKPKEQPANDFEQWFFENPQTGIHLEDRAASAALLRQLHAQASANRLSSGIEQLGIGYPLLLREDGSPLPLFIRPVVLEASQEQYNNWRLYGLGDARLYLFPPARQLLRQGGADIFLREAARWMKNPFPNLQKLKDLLLLLSAETGWPVEEDRPHPLPKPPENSLPSPCMVRSALLGIFPPAASPALLTKQRDKTEKKPKPTAASAAHRIGFDILPPPQASAVEAALQNSCCKIRVAHPQTGLQTIFELLGRLLANGQAVLTVSDKTSPLQQLQQMLEQKQIGHLGFLIRQPDRDFKTLADLAAAFAKSHPAGKYEPDRKEQLEQNIVHSSQTLNRLARKHHLLRSPRPDGHCYEEWVGLFLHHKKHCGPEILNSMAALKELEFSASEGEQLGKKLELAEQLFQNIRRARHPLSELHPRFFTDMPEDEARKTIEELLNTFAERLHETHHRLIHLQAQYRMQLLQYLENRYLAAGNALRNLHDAIREGEQKFGRPFKSNGISMLKWKAPFSKNTAKVLAAREKLLQEYQKLKTLLSDIPDLQVELPPPAPALLPAQIAQALNNTQQRLEVWRDEKRSEMEEHVHRMSAKNIWEVIPAAREVPLLEKDFDQLIEAFNESRIYHAPFENRALTLHKRQQLIEQLLEQLENTRQHLDEFPRLYKWQHFLLRLPAKSRKLILALARINPVNWRAAFFSWHYQRLLAKHYTPAMQELISEQEKNTCLALTRKAQSSLPEYIKLYWQEKSMKNNQKAKSKNEQPSFDDTNLAAFFPALFLNAFSAAARFPKVAENYDYLLLIDYGGLPKEWEEAAADYALPCSRWHVQDADEQEDSGGIYLPKGIPKASPAECKLIPANGHFEAEGLNLAEADQIIQMLNSMHPKEGKTYARMAMVTFCEAQRTRLNDYLRRLQMQKGSNQRLLTELFRRGLAVFLPHEINGMSYELLLVSLCYDENEIQKTGESKLQKQLQKLRDIAQSGMYLVHSLPEEHPLLKKITKDEQPATGEKQLPLPCPVLLQELQEQLQKEQTESSVSILHTASQMGIILKRKRAAEYKIEAKEEKEQLLIIDGLLAPTPYAAPLWELQTQHTLARMKPSPRELPCANLWMQTNDWPTKTNKKT